MSLFESASLVVTPNGTKASKLYAIKPTDGSGDLSVTRATTATRVNSSGLIELVGANVPRLDYSNGTCPSILVEPQRTNLLKYSEDLTNAVWSLIGTITRTANYGTAPDGTQTSTRIQWGGGANFELYQYSGSASPVFGSLYVKGIAGQTINFNGSTKTFNGDWQRIEELLIIDGSNTYMSIRGIVGGTTALDFQLWGAQGEAGSYATSYIPTTSASVTRNADVISKTGISSLIGQTEGTLFIDLYASSYNADGTQYSLISFLGDSNENVQLYTDNSLLRYNIKASGENDATTGVTFLNGNRYKISISYKSGDCVVYVNGVLRSTSNKIVMPLMSALYINQLNTGSFIAKNNFNTVALWKTRLTNAQLTELTTI